MSRKPSLRWKMSSKATGLASVCAPPRTHELWYGNVRVATLYHWRPPGFARRDFRGFYWAAPTNVELGIEHVNTYCDSGPDWEYEQLKEAKAHVRDCILRRIKQSQQSGK